MFRFSIFLMLSLCFSTLSKAELSSNSYISRKNAKNAKNFGRANKVFNAHLRSLKNGVQTRNNIIKNEILKRVQPNLKIETISIKFHPIAYYRHLPNATNFFKEKYDQKGTISFRIKTKDKKVIIGRTQSTISPDSFKWVPVWEQLGMSAKKATALGFDQASTGIKIGDIRLKQVTRNASGRLETKRSFDKAKKPLW